MAEIVRSSLAMLKEEALDEEAMAATEALVINTRETTGSSSLTHIIRNVTK